MRFIAVATLLFSVASSPLAVAAPRAAAPNRPEIRIVMSVDWEGEALGEANLAQMQSLRQDFPDLPIVHYLNAAYFTKSDADPEALTASIQAVLRPQDQLGMHIHSWKSLMEAAGVTYRGEPNWVAGGGPLIGAACAYDCGFSIPLSAYTTAEIRQVLAYSREILGAHGFGQAVHFRTGGWNGAPNVLAALAAEGFRTDSSAANVSLIAPRLPGYPLVTWLDNLWPNIDALSQPYVVATAAGELTEMPDNGALADYVTAAQMLSVLKQNIAAARPGNVRWVVVGFHQETANDWLPRVRGFLAGVTRLQAGGANITFSVMPGSN